MEEVCLPDLPDVALDRIYDFVLAGIQVNSSDNYMWFLHCNQTVNPHLAKMASRPAQIGALGFRLVCRKLREVANRRAIPVDLLLNNCDSRFLMSRTLLYPFMTSHQTHLYKKLTSVEYWEDYRLNVNNNIPPPDWLASYWKPIPRVSFRLIASNFSLLTKVNPRAFVGRISEVHVGTSRSRAIHVWAETGFDFVKRLGAERLCIGALRISASSGMRLLSSGKNAASLEEMKQSFHLTCMKLIYVMESSYAGNGSDLSVQMPCTTRGVILTSGINSIQYHNRRAFFRDDWNFDALPGPNVVEKGYANIRAIEELSMQYIFIESFDKLMEFFPRLKAVTLYKGCYLRRPNMTQAALSALLASKLSIHGLTVTIANSTAFVY